MTQHDWIVCHDGSDDLDAYAAECLRCGKKQRFALPISVSVYCAALRAFVELHSRCKPKSEEAKR